MRYLVFLFSVMASMQMYGQDPIVTDTDWYFISLFADGQTYEVPSPDPVAPPTLQFFDDNGMDVMSTYITDDAFSAKVDIDASAGTLTTSEATITLFGCSQFCDLEAAYFDFLYKDGNPVTFDYEITIVDGAEDGKYQLQIFDNEGNFAFYDSKFLNVSEEKLTPITVYPNPATDFIQIQTAGVPLETIRILSISGNEVLKVDGATHRIDIAGLTSGIYFLELTQAGRKRVQKMIKR